MGATELLASTTVLWKLLEECGHDPAALYRQAGIDPEQVLEPRARVPLRAINNIWLKVVELIPDPCFGLRTAKHWHPSQLDALGFAWLASTTLRGALKRLVRYSRIVSEGFDVRLKETPKGLSLCVHLIPAYKKIPAASDATLAIIMHMCRVNYGEDLKPVEVALTHAEQPCSEKLHAFFRSPVKFGANCDSITLPVPEVDRKLLGGNPYLAEINDQLIVQYLLNLDKDEIIQQVKSAITQRLSRGDISDEKIAPFLNMSVRSLQRKLQSVGTTFQTVLDETRREIADKYLGDSNTSLAEVTFVLGFSEQSSFSRAYKRWTGFSPSEVRNVG